MCCGVQLKKTFSAAERKRVASLGREEMFKEEGNRLFKAAKFEEAIEKYTQALNAVSDPSSELYLSILNNRCGIGVLILLSFLKQSLCVWSKDWHCCA